MDSIIIADDSMIIKDIIEKEINDEYKVLKAENGKELVKYITDKKENIKGIFLDLSMPDYDGFYVLNYFKNNNLFKRYPIVIISGDDSKETIKKAFTYDIVDMLNKPFNMYNIKNMINKMDNYRN